MYSKVIQGLGFALRFPHLTTTIQKNKESSIVLSSRTKNSITRTRTLHRCLWHKHQSSAVDQSTDVDRYSQEGRKIKYINVLQMCKIDIGFRLSLPSNYFLKFFDLKQTQTKKIVCFVSFKVLHKILLS